MDDTVTNNIHAFFKFAYEQNLNAGTFVPGTYQSFANVDFTPSYGGGVDITHGHWTHTFRIGYLKFRNGITDAVTGSPIFNPAPLLALAIGNVSTSCMRAVIHFAPARTFLLRKRPINRTSSLNMTVLGVLTATSCVMALA